LLDSATKLFAGVAVAVAASCEQRESAVQSFVELEGTTGKDAGRSGDDDGRTCKLASLQRTTNAVFSVAMLNGNISPLILSISDLKACSKATGSFAKKNSNSGPLEFEVVKGVH
jgi:hypothetical protein